MFRHFLKYSLAIITIPLVACSTNSHKTKEANTLTSLPDSLFVLKNIKSSLFRVDSATMKKYVEIDSIQQKQLITPTILDDIITSQDYINHDMGGYFIAKQNKIGSFSPIIVSMSGDDYSALILLLLDTNKRPVSHILLSGGVEAGPDGEIGDSIILLHNTESILNNDIITTYTLHIRQSEKNDTIPPTIDSIVNVRKILPNGTIKLLKTDSSRYTRKYNFPDHCW